MPKFIAILFLAIPLLFFGQEKKLEIDLGELDPEKGPYSTYSFVNKEKDRVCILVLGKSSIKGFILNSDYILIKQFVTGKQPTNDFVVGGFFAGDKIHFLLSRFEQDDNISHFVYDPETDMNTFSAIDLQIRKSMFLGGISLGDQFLFINVDKKEDKINVFRFSEKEIHEAKQFDLAASGATVKEIYKILSETSGKNFVTRLSEVAYINDWEHPSIEMAKKFGKMYYRNDSLIIIADRVIDKVLTFGLDLRTQKAGIREIKRAFNICPNVKDMRFVTHASFLLNNHLYSVASCSDAMQLSIYDFYSGSIIKQYSTLKDEEISFRSSDILAEGGAFFSRGERKLEKTKQLLRMMVNGRSVIIAKNVDASTVELTIGSYKVRREVLGAGPTGFGTTINMGPTTAPVIVNSGFSREWTEIARFKSLININDFQVVKREVEKPIEEVIETYTKEVRILKDCEGIYPVKDKLGYYYIERKKSKLVVSSL